jgi:putative hydrolase of the HAD superfamily
MAGWELKNTVLFDLGNTLVHYFESHEFPDILKQAITEVQNCLQQKGLLCVSSSEMWRKVREEDYSASDYRVRPLEERLSRIFQLGDLADFDNLVTDLCRCFMKPIFARSYRYEDTLPVLRELKQRGFRVALVSNTTWGSPANLWREEMQHHGISQYVDVSVFCRDVGWRKPARQIFEYTLQKLQADAQQCVFVGDEIRWDCIGPRTVGISPIIIQRNENAQTIKNCVTIKNLHELLEKLENL